MTKKCKVLLYNSSVMVIDFDGKQIQMPSVPIDDLFVYVKCIDEKYTLITQEKYEEIQKVNIKELKDIPYALA